MAIYAIVANFLPWLPGMKRILTLLIILFSYCSSPSLWSKESSGGKESRLQTMLDDFRHKHNLVGMAMGALSTKSRDSLLLQAYSGVTINHSTVQVTKDNLFAIGGMTKGFTAVLLLRLQADPRYHFDLDEPLSHVLGGYPNWGEITTRQLLNQTSGLICSQGLQGFIQDRRQDPPPDWTAAVLNYAKDEPLGYETGKGWSYCDTNYILAGEVYEAVTGHSIKYGIERMVRQFGLNNTYFIQGTISGEIHKKMVHGYEEPDQDGNRLDYTGLSFDWAGAAGAMVSNIEDLSRWYKLLYTTDEILGPESLQQLQTTVCMKADRSNGCDFAGQTLPLNTTVPSYGLGVAHTDKMWWHNGSVPGYFSYYLYQTDKQSIGISLADSHKTGEDLFDMTHKAAMVASDEDN